MCITADGSAPDSSGTSQENETTWKQSDRPARPCPFCSKFLTRLTRHLKMVHKSEESVRKCLKGSHKEQRDTFRQLKRNGMLKHNREMAGRQGATLLRDRVCKNDGGVVVCDACSGVFSRRYFSTHQKKCPVEQCIKPRPIAASLYCSSFQIPEDFKRDVLAKFTYSDVDRLCKKNKVLIMIGSKLYEKRRAREKKTLEVRLVMTGMRRLGHVFLRFQDLAQQSGTTSPTGDPVSVLDMFRKQNFNLLRQACSSYTASDMGKEKLGLALAVYYLLVKAARIVKVFHWVNDDTIKATEVSEFLDAWNRSKRSILGAAARGSGKNRSDHPGNCPQLRDVVRIRNYTRLRIRKLLGDKYLIRCAAKFLELRDLACARVMLFNARHGCEPARLHISDWTDACNERLLDKELMRTISKEEQELVRKSFVMYQTAVSHPVPVLVPQDTAPVLEKLSNATVRRSCGISKNNVYLFPRACPSSTYANGWQALDRVSCRAGVDPIKITSVEGRHLASTMYASLELPESKHSAFYSQMGHVMTVNDGIHQAPLTGIEALGK